MKKEAEANADSDKKAKEQVEKVNAADAMIFKPKSSLKITVINCLMTRKSLLKKL